MEPGNPRIELEIQGHRYNQYYCGLFCPAAQWCGLVPGQVEKKEKQKSRWRSAQSVDACSSKHLNKKKFKSWIQSYVHQSFMQLRPTFQKRSCKCVAPQLI